MASTRRLSIASLLVGLGAGVALIGVASPASADTGISNPSSGAVITGSSVTVRASADVFTGRLLLNETKLDQGTGSLSRGVNTHSTRNGSYTAVLEQLGVTGLFWHRKDEVTFTVRTAPYAPAGTRASVAGRKVSLRWTRGPEPDLTGYEIISGGKVKDGSVGALCSGDDCSTTVSVPVTVAGKVSFKVRARRATGSGGSLTSDTSTASVSFPVGGGPGTATSQGPSVGGFGGPGTRLNPLGQSPLALPPVTPNGAVNGFQYPTPDPEVAAPVPIGVQDVSATGPYWATSLALALVILLAAAHLGMWLRRARLALPASATGSLGRTRTTRRGEFRRKARAATVTSARRGSGWTARIGRGGRTDNGTPAVRTSHTATPSAPGGQERRRRN